MTLRYPITSSTTWWQLHKWGFSHLDERRARYHIDAVHGAIPEIDDLVEVHRILHEELNSAHGVYNDKVLR